MSGPDEEAPSPLDTFTKAKAAWISRTEAAELRHQCGSDITMAALPLQMPSPHIGKATFPHSMRATSKWRWKVCKTRQR